MGTLSGEATLSFFSVAFPANCGQLLKERICSHWSKFFPLRVDSILGRLHLPGKQTGSLANCLPLKNMAEKDGDAPIHLNLLQYLKDIN